MNLGKYEINNIYCGDNSELIKELPDNCIDLTVTSPPYDNLRTYKGYSWDFETLAKELFRVTKQGGVVVWVVGDATINGNETGTSFKQALYFKDIGFNLHDTMIYLKNCVVYPEFTRYYNGFEFMFILSKNKIKTFNPINDRKNVSEGRKIYGCERKQNGELKRFKSRNGSIIKNFGMRFNYWLIHNCKRGIETKHPAIFPEQLAADHIISWSNENDIVFDPFIGSGTTAKAAINNNRNYLGFEISQDYIDIANERLRQMQLFNNGD